MRTYPVKVAVDTPALNPAVGPAPATALPLAITTSKGRGALIPATAAVVAALAATTVALVALTDRPPAALGPGRPAAEFVEPPLVRPTLVGDPPADLRLREDGSSITITWTDPTAGGVPFIVAGGRAGTTLGALATINPGEKSFTLNGLNPRADYCFTVVAVYSADRYATSGQVCTRRATPTDKQSTPRR